MLDRVRLHGSAAYVSFLDAHPQSLLVGDQVLLYGHTELDERNETFELERYLPGWVTIGDDSGGTALLMRLDGTPEVHGCDHGAIGSLPASPVAASFAAWLTADCPLP